jgi:hypothetical protein
VSRQNVLPVDKASITMATLEDPGNVSEIGSLLIWWLTVAFGALLSEQPEN